MFQCSEPTKYKTYAGDQPTPYKHKSSYKVLGRLLINQGKPGVAAKLVTGVYLSWMTEKKWFMAENTAFEKLYEPTIIIIIIAKELM